MEKGFQESEVKKNIVIASRVRCGDAIPNTTGRLLTCTGMQVQVSSGKALLAMTE